MRRYGIDTLLVAAPATAPRFSLASAAPSVGQLEPAGREYAASAFVEDLYRLGQLESVVALPASAGRSKPPVVRHRRLEVETSGA